MITGHGTKKVLLMKFEILGLVAMLLLDLLFFGLDFLGGHDKELEDYCG